MDDMVSRQSTRRFDEAVKGFNAFWLIILGQVQGSACEIESGSDEEGGRAYDHGVGRQQCSENCSYESRGKRETSPASARLDCH